MSINVTRSALPSFEEYCGEIKDLWDTRWLTNNGAKHRELEAQLSAFLDAPNVTLFTNGHLALENALAAFELEGEVITTPFTFTSTTHAIVRNGLEPVFCDVEPVNYTLDPAKLEALITPRTCAIVPVHVYGNLCDVAAIEKIAREHGLRVIYDAAHAFGESLWGENAANFGDASMFSFHATKVFHTVEGGAVTCRSSEIRNKLEMMKNFGIPGPDRISYAGGNAKMSELHAAMGICNLRHIDEYIAGRRAVVERYRRNLAGVPGLRLCPVQEGVRSNYAYFPVVFEDAKYTRDEAAEKLAEQDIFARKYFYPLTNDCECYGMNGDGTPVAKHIAGRVLTLPLYPELSLADVDRICEIICGE